MSITVLFVCLGNICRSPMADAVFQKLVAEAGLADKIAMDSAGTGGWHVGETAHSGTLRVLQEQGIIYHGRARKVTHSDMADKKSWIIAMDSSNLDDLQRQYGDHPRLHRLLDFAHNYSDVHDVPDPYYTGNFTYVYDLVKDGCEGLLAHICQVESV